MRKLFTAVIFAAAILSTADAEPAHYSSSEFGFITMFPSAVAFVKIESALGPLSTFAAFDEEKGLYYSIEVFEVKELRDYNEMKRDIAKIFLESSFAAKTKEIKATNVKSEQVDRFAFAALKFSYSQVGKFAEGITSHKSGYEFVHNQTAYTVSVERFDDSTPQGDEVDKFMFSLAFASKEDIEAFQKVSPNREAK